MTDTHIDTTAPTAFDRDAFLAATDAWIKAVGASLPLLFPETPGGILRFCARFEIGCDGMLRVHRSGFITVACDSPSDEDFLDHKDKFTAHNEMFLRRAIHEAGCPLRGSAFESLSAGLDRMVLGVYHWLTGGTLDAGGFRAWQGADQGVEDPLGTVAWDEAFFAFYFTFNDAGQVVHTSFGVGGIEGEPSQALGAGTLERFLRLIDTFRALPDGHPFPADLRAA